MKVSYPEVPPADWYAITMGQMGQEIGMICFENPDALSAIARESDPSIGREHFHGLSFSMNEKLAIHPDEVAAAEQFGWPVPAPEAWPSAFVVDGGSLSPVNADQLRFLPIAIKAVTARLI